jgi:hypothetical protein
MLYQNFVLCFIQACRWNSVMKAWRESPHLHHLWVQVLHTARVSATRSIFLKLKCQIHFFWMWRVTPSLYQCTSTILLANTAYLYHNFCDCRLQWPCGVRSGVCGLSPAGIAGSNPVGCMNVCYLWMLCLLSGRALCDRSIACPEESSRMWCFWVWSRSIKDEPDLPSKSAINRV